jgi:hypothetical protein
MLAMVINQLKGQTQAEAETVEGSAELVSVPCVLDPCFSW